MAQIFVSPGVYSQEIDASFRAPQVSNGRRTALVGFTNKGIAFRPTRINDAGDFTTLFGGQDPDKYATVAANRFFNSGRNGSGLLMTRVLGTGTAEVGKPVFLAFPPAASDVNNVFRAGNVVGAILRTREASDALDYRITGTKDGFSLSSSDGSVSLTNLSLDPNSNNWVGNIFSRDPKSSSKVPKLYLDAVFQGEYTSLGTGGIVGDTVDTEGYAAGYVSATGDANHAQVAGGFSSAETPWVVSQSFAGSVNQLFKFHTIAHGDYENANLKVLIDNVDTTSTEWPSFSVRLAYAVEAGGVASGPVTQTIESWSDVNMNPESDKYIAKVIGTQFITYDMSQDPPASFVDGEFPLVSRTPMVRVEMASDAPTQYDRPAGFTGVGRILPSGTRLTEYTGSDISFEADPGANTITTGGAGGLDFSTIEDTATITVAGTTVTKTALVANNSDTDNDIDFLGDGILGIALGSPVSDSEGIAPAGSIVSATAGNIVTILDGEGGSPVNYPAFTSDITFTFTNNDGTYNVASVTTTTIDIETTFPVGAGLDAGPSITITETDTQPIQIPEITYRTNHLNLNSQKDQLVYMGVDYSIDGVLDRLSKTVTSANGSTSADNGLLIHATAADVSAGNPADYEIVDVTSETSSLYAGRVQFSLPFTGGFDGYDPRVDQLLAMNASDTSSLTGDIFKAVRILSNVDDFDFNVLAIPGIHTSGGGGVVQKSIDMVASRGDAFFIADLAPNNSTTGAGLNMTYSEAITQANSLDTSYAASYFPWGTIRVNNRLVPVPPSVIIPGVYRANDTIKFPWFAPAGFTRGAMPADFQPYGSGISQTIRDDLYSNNVNPIAKFVGQGNVIFGQKTLQQKESLLDRISVRRMLLEVRKYISSLSRVYLFEQNTVSTRSKLLGQINSYLETVQSNQGVTEFRAVLDETTTTPDLIDRNIMKGKIFLKPTSAAEVILFDFTVSPQGASFSE